MVPSFLSFTAGAATTARLVVTPVLKSCLIWNQCTFTLGALKSAYSYSYLFNRQVDKMQLEIRKGNKRMHVSFVVNVMSVKTIRVIKLESVDGQNVVVVEFGGCSSVRSFIGGGSRLCSMWLVDIM